MILVFHHPNLPKHFLMPDAPSIINTTMETFQTDVIQQSAVRPVVVDFWADWCGPCKQLIPILEKLTAEAKGAFCLVKVNVDQCPEIAGAFGVQSIPFVVAMLDGQPVSQFAGVKPEPELRAWLKAFMPSPAAEAFEQGQQHETDGSLELAEATGTELRSVGMRGGQTGFRWRPLMQDLSKRAEARRGGWGGARNDLTRRRRGPPRERANRSDASLTCCSY